MKFIDLLVNEKIKFPDGAQQAVQDFDATIKFFNSHDLRLGDSMSWMGTPSGSFFCCAGDKIKGLDLSHDWKSAIITRDQYESALAASQKPAWNGDGLPPVGCECEWRDTNVGWLPVTIKYISEQIVVMASPTNLCGVRELTEIAKDIICDKPQFRPLRTEADKKREAICDAIYGALTRAEREHNRSDEAEAVYDAIAAGKIPGVKLED